MQYITPPTAQLHMLKSWCCMPGSVAAIKTFLRFGTSQVQDVIVALDHLQMIRDPSNPHMLPIYISMAATIHKLLYIYQDLLDKGLNMYGGAHVAQHAKRDLQPSCTALPTMCTS